MSINQDFGSYNDDACRDITLITDIVTKINR